MWHAISTLLAETLDENEISQRRVLPGGELHTAWYLRYGPHHIFVKSDGHELLQKFADEADQLALLARSKTVRVPQVYGVGSARESSFLLLEYLPPRPFDAHGAWRFGQQLARLHQWSEQPQFGLDFDNDLSTLPQPNAWQRRWSRFFAEQRIGWQLQLAAEKGLVFGDIDTLIDRVEQRLHDHQPQPSLLHGDLWPDNCANSDQGGFLFDPASYWGDRECDLATLPLFSQMPPQIYDGYQSVWPLDKDFVRRQPVYQLYYRLKDAILFGGEHVPAAAAALDSVLAAGAGD
ncbi:Phosphotransferase/kinase [Sodalis praecaptivus]|uniref:Phosphotransferase/kinase n=1 Tax=Sodalis praecaptivus TaxID=1239307 RepID=W0HTP3_9GAMM|nr:fructosamine kinase family protein [Sodalis praecaptivus]AHF77134.1 Phosphotransferase/kinase [Sodalis praecaptivus]